MSDAPKYRMVAQLKFSIKKMLLKYILNLTVSYKRSTKQYNHKRTCKDQVLICEYKQFLL